MSEKKIDLNMKLADFSKPNANGHVYEPKALKEALRKWMDSPTRMGIMAAPQALFATPKEIQRAGSSINMADVCCSFDHPTFNPDSLELRAQVRPFGPKGPALRKLLENEVPVNFSLRGLGRMEGDEVFELTQLTTFNVTDGQ